MSTATHTNLLASPKVQRVLYPSLVAIVLTVVVIALRDVIVY